MTKASYAFIATGIGAVIAALGLALAALVSYFKSSGDGADKFAKLTSQASAVVDVLIDRVASLVRTIGAFLSGDIKGGIDGLKKTFGGLGDEISKEITLAGELADALDEIEDRERNYRVALSETETKIKALLIQAKDRTLSEKERIKLLDEAFQLEKANNEELISIKRKALDEAVKEAAARTDITQQENETLEAFAKRLINNQKLADEVKNTVASALVASNEAAQSSISLNEKIDNQKNALEEKSREERRKRQEDEEKEQEEAAQRAVARTQSIIDAELEAVKKANEFKKEFYSTDEVNASSSIARIAKIREQQRKEERKRDQEDLKRKKEDRAQELDGQRATIAAGLNLARQAFGASKAIAIAETVINTVRGITRALADYAFPYSLIVSALVGAAGTLQTARIANIKFAKGGEYNPNNYLANGGRHVSVGGRPHSQGGTKYYGEDGNGFEVEQGEGIYVMKRDAEAVARLSDLNTRHGGKSWVESGAYPGMQKNYALGGEIAFRSQSSQQNNIERTVRAVMANMPPVFVAVEDINTGQNNYAQVVNRANL